MSEIAKLEALEILDFRGNPTLAVTATLSNGVKTTAKVPSVVAARIDAIIESCLQQLTQKLQSLRNKPEADRPGWGSLGRAAEFLVSQRGLHS
jgi:hypothetical protein